MPMIPIHHGVPMAIKPYTAPSVSPLISCCRKNAVIAPPAARQTAAGFRSPVDRRHVTICKSKGQSVLRSLADQSW